MKLKRIGFTLAIMSMVGSSFFMASSAEAKPYQRKGTHSVKKQKPNKHRSVRKKQTRNRNQKRVVKKTQKRQRRNRRVTHQPYVRTYPSVRWHQPVRYPSRYRHRNHRVVQPVYCNEHAYYETYDPYYFDPSWDLGINSDGNIHLGVNF